MHIVWAKFMWACESADGSKERSLPLIGKQMILPASSITLNLLSVVKVYILCVLFTYVEFDIFKNNIRKCDLWIFALFVSVNSNFR